MSDAEPAPRKKRKRKKRKKKAPATDHAEVIAEHARKNGFEVLRHQRMLGLGGTIAIVGLGLVGTHDSKVGSTVVIVGLLILMWAVHRFGRLGTERLGKRAAR